MNSLRSKTLVILSLAMIGLILLLAACGGDDEEAATIEPTQEAEQVTLVISGSGTTTQILAGVEAAFEADNPGYDLDLLAGSGTGGGVQGILDDVLDVAAMARAPKDEEAEQGVQYVEIGLVSEGILTHPDVGVTELTTEQMIGIFTGEIENWSEVDGPDLTVSVFVRDEADSSTQAMRESVLGDTEFPEAIVSVMTSQSEMQAAVSGNEGAIGYGSWSSAVAAGADVVALEIDGMHPARKRLSYGQRCRYWLSC